MGVAGGRSNVRRGVSVFAVSSTRRLLDLPSPRRLFGLARSLALVELAMNPKPHLRWHTLDHSVRHLVRVSSGGGDEAMVWLSDRGCVVRGFDHESPISPWAQSERQLWPGLVDGFPPAFANGPRLSITEDVENLTFLLWWLDQGPWQVGSLSPPDLEPINADIDGSEYLMSSFASEEGGLAFLSEYYEAQFPSDLLDRFPFNGSLSVSAFVGLPRLRPYDAIAEELAGLGIRLDGS